MSRSDQCCDAMAHAIEPDSGIQLFYVPRFRLWVIQNVDMPEHSRQIDFCPWCGTELLASLGEERLSEIRRRGLDPVAADDDLPGDLLDDRWWKALGI